MASLFDGVSGYSRGTQRTGQAQKAGSSKYTSAKLKKDLEQAAQTAYDKWQKALKELERMKAQMQADYKAYQNNPKDNNLKMIYQTRQRQCIHQELLCNELREKWHNAMNACMDASK